MVCRLTKKNIDLSWYLYPTGGKGKGADRSRIEHQSTTARKKDRQYRTAE